MTNIIFSYPGEYARYVEYCAEILERYLGKQRVFHYTNGDERCDREAFFTVLEGWLARREPIQLVCLCHDQHIVQAQHLELAGWEKVVFERAAAARDLQTLFVDMPRARGQNPRPEDLGRVLPAALQGDRPRGNLYKASDIGRSSAEYLAEFLLRPALSLPGKQPTAKAFTYEKDIIQFYARLHEATHERPFVELPEAEQKFFLSKFTAGVPMVWPSIRVRTNVHLSANQRLEQIGSPRVGLDALLAPDPATVGQPTKSPNLVSVSALQGLGASNLSFLEAGPRDQICSLLNVAIVVSGGISPGINAVIDGIVQRHRQYNRDCTVHGFMNGFFGVAQNPPKSIHLYPRREDFHVDEHCMATSEQVSRGGSMIGTIRLGRLDDGSDKSQQMLGEIVHTLGGYDVVYIIGGDGSMKMANMLLRELRRVGSRVAVVGIPKSMDNDILWVWQSFGFATAVEKAREVIDCLSVEKNSNPRICIVQLFGSVSGFVVSHAVLACQPGECDVALIPEVGFSISAVANCIRRRLRPGVPQDQCILDGLVVMAETAIPIDWRHYVGVAELTDSERKSVEEFEKVRPPDFLDGQTSDELRSAGLKLLQRGLEAELRKNFKGVVRVFANEPRHILRSANPSFSDIIFGQRLGGLAVDNALAGYSDFMVSQWLTEFVLVPLRLVSIGRKRIHKDGIFWKSVLAKTGQGELV